MVSFDSWFPIVVELIQVVDVGIFLDDEGFCDRVVENVADDVRVLNGCHSLKGKVANAGHASAGESK